MGTPTTRTVGQSSAEYGDTVQNIHYCDTPVSNNNSNLVRHPIEFSLTDKYGYIIPYDLNFLPKIINRSD
ncbi:hypothetical protein TNCV_4555941 [Trichonephila clavipes]|nr:hypothetical protein TNCV_4555941 [Trichonephila clavipes]